MATTVAAVADEVALEVLRMACETPRDAARAARVCRRWARLAEDEELWRQLYWHALGLKPPRSMQDAWTRRGPQLLVDRRPRPLAPRRREVLATGSWRDACEALARLAGEANPVGFNGFFTDGGHDTSMPGTEMRRRHWAGNAFRPDSKSFYCSEAQKNVVLCGVLSRTAPRGQSGSAWRDPETRAERKELLRRKALLGCLKGSYYDISTRPQVLNRASTSELERMFVEIVENPAGRELLVSAKFGWSGLPFFLSRSGASRATYREGLRTLAAKIRRERQSQRDRDRESISEAAKLGLRAVFHGAFALDADNLTVVRPSVLVRDWRLAARQPHIRELAVVQRLVVEREGNFTCPVNCGALFVAGDLLLPPLGPVEEDAGLARAAQLAQEACAGLDTAKSWCVMKSLDDVTDRESVRALAANGALPPILHEREERGGALQVLEFDTPRAPRHLGPGELELVAWFKIAQGSLCMKVDIPLIRARTARYLAAKLISSEDRMALEGESQAAPPNIDCSGVYAFGHVLRFYL